MKIIKAGQTVWHWNMTYERYTKDVAEHYDKEIKMWWLTETEDWFTEDQLFKTKHDCAHANFPTI